jgi:hypothetical protein
MPELLIAVMIITVNNIRTTIAPMTMNISNQSVTLDIDCAVSLITLMAVVSVVAPINSDPIREKIMTISPIIKSITTSDNKIVNPATPLSVLSFILFILSSFQFLIRNQTDFFFIIAWIEWIHIQLLSNKRTIVPMIAIAIVTPKEIPEISPPIQKNRETTKVPYPATANAPLKSSLAL